MRWIFFFLLTANLALFVWRMLFAPVAESTSVQMLGRLAPPALAAKEVILLRELDPRAVTVREEMIVASDPSLCIMVGAFASQADAHQFMARLAALDVASFEHPIDLSAGEGHWVYLQPFANRDEARRRLAELQAKGIDSYIIPKGELENGISLGVFTRRDLAEARLADLRRLGLPVNLYDIERSYREYWVMLGKSEEHKLDESVWLDLLRENISLQRRQNLCSDVASAKNFH